MGDHEGSQKTRSLAFTTEGTLKGTISRKEQALSQSALYSKRQAQKANLSLIRLGIASWEPQDVRTLQTKVKAKPVDGWFGPKSIKAWKKWARKHDSNLVQTGHALGFSGVAIINGCRHPVPDGLRYINHTEPGGIPAQIDDTSLRKRVVTQLILHRGYAGPYKPFRNFAAKTEQVLDQRGLSSTHSMDIDGTVYQHFDVGIRRGRHATYHNVQSDSLDVAGPFEWKYKGAPGQTKMTFKAAIGRKNDGLPPLVRSYGKVKCWSLTPEQDAALAIFVPWWCQVRGIPLTACDDWRCFRLGGAGIQDPVTNVKGILSHVNVSGPGRRVDGVLPLISLKRHATGIRWRSGEDFFD